MKKKFSTIWQVMVALVLICSLLVFSGIPAGAVTGLGVSIVTPTDGTDYHVGETINVTATITPADTDADDVIVTLGLTGEAELVGGSASYNVGPIPAYWSDTTVNWTLKCTGPGDVAITVTAQAANGPSGSAGPVTVHQLTQEELTVTIDPPAASEICKCTNFEVDAWVKNTGDFTISDIDVTLGIDGDAELVSPTLTQNIIDLAKGASTEVTWTLHCYAGAIGNCPSHNYVDLEVTAVGDGPISGTDAVTGSYSYDNYVDQKYLMLEITAPEPPQEYCVGDEFYVDANIKNCFEQDVEGTLTLTLDPASGAVIEEPPAAVQENVTIPGEGEIDLSDDGGPQRWHLTCAEGGDLNITVSFLGIAGTTTLCDKDTVIIPQKSPADLDVELSGPSCVAYSQDFDVTATVTNTGGPGAATATGVNADLDLLSGDVTGDMPDKAVADIPAGESRQVSWTLNCNGPTDAEFDITVTGSDDCETVLEAADTLSVMQIDLEMSVLNTPSGPYRPSQEFCVTATLTNHEPEDTVTVDSVTIDPPGSTNLVSGEDATKPVGDILPGESQQISWTLHCNSEGSSDYVLVNADVTEPCEVTISALTGTFDQEYPPTTLKLELLSPDEGAKYATSQEFAVTAVVTNTGGQPAENAVVGIHGNGFDVIDAPGETVPGEGVMLGTLEPGESETLTWTLHCDESGLTRIFACTWAINLDLGGEQECFDLIDFVRVWQYPAAHLEVQILDDVTPDEIVTCNTFDVTAIIRNTGEADATEVYATLSVNPDGSVRVSADDPEGTYTKYVGTIPGHDSEANYKYVTWNLHCKVACESEITVTVTGNDEYGWHIKQENSTTGNFQIELGALVSQQLIAPYVETYFPEYGYGYSEEPNRGWAYGIFVGDANQLPPGPFLLDTDISIIGLYSGNDYLGHVTGHGYVVPSVNFMDMMFASHVYDHAVNYLELLHYYCGYDPDEVKGEDVMFWVVHVTMDSSGDFMGFEDPTAWCISGGLLEVINGTVVGSYNKCISQGDRSYDDCYQDSLLGGTFYSNLAAEPGRTIPEKFIEPDGVTIKQLPLSTDLEVTKEVEGDDTVTVGETVTFTITVENLGPSDATGIFVYDLLPAGLNFTGLTLSQGWYYVGEGQWSVGDLAEGETATLTLTATVNTVGEIYNAAVVGYLDQHDPITTNDVGVAMVTGEAPEAVTSWEITVGTGYNLISLPLIPDGDNIEAMTAPLEDLIKIYRYDALLEPPDWLEYDPTMPFPSGSTLFTMEDGYGYWVKMTNPDSFTFDGWELVAETDPPSVPPSYDVVEGWNLIGFKSTTPKPAAEYLDGIDGKYVMIYGYDGGFFIAGSPGHEYLQPGLGYWLALKIGESGTIYP